MDSIPIVLDLLERIQRRLVKTLSTFPEAGAVFQGKVWIVSFSVLTYIKVRSGECHANRNR